MTHDRVTLAGIMISIGVLYGGLALGADRVHQPAPHGRIQPPQWPRGTIVVVHFPAPGVYPYEVDYDECCGGQLVLTMASGTNNGHVVPPTGSRALSPSGVGAQPIGHARTFTVAAQDGSGAPLANHPIVLVVSGAGYQQLRGTTDAAGVATFTYTGTIAGTDNVQAIASASGLPSYSNVIAVPWTSSSGLGSGSAYPQAEPGWIASPADFSQVSGRGSQS